MLCLHFEVAPGEDYALVGPAPYFRLAGDRLQVGPGDTDIASYRQGKWHYPTGSFVSVTAPSPTQISFTGGSTSPMISGPFAQVRFAEGAIWHGDGFSELVAQFDERSQSWRVYPDRGECSGAVIASVPGTVRK